MRLSARFWVSCSTTTCFILATTAFAAPQKPVPLAPIAECASLLTEEIPVTWVKKMMVDGLSETPDAKRLRDIVQRLGFTQAALNAEVIRAHNDSYTVELEQGISTDQKQSGRCWIFAGLNMIRSSLIAEGVVPPEFEFSESHTYFFSMLEQSNNYLENVIEQTMKPADEKGTDPHGKPRLTVDASFAPTIADGGNYDTFMYLVSKYGLVPKSAMPETRSSENSSALGAELKRQLSRTARDMLEFNNRVATAKAKIRDADYIAALRAIKSRGMTGIWKILATHLGDPPQEFEFRTSKKPRQKGPVSRTTTKITHYTPQSFATSFADFNADDYVLIGATQDVPEGVYEQNDDANAPWRGQKEFMVRFLNVSIARMEELTMASIEGGHPVWFAADVTQDVDNRTGIMHPRLYDRDPLYNFDDSERLSKLNRSASSFFGVTTPNHAMLLTGFDRPSPNQPVIKFKNENSWGKEVGTNGTYALYREWFEANVFQIVVNKKFLTPQEQASWKSKAITLDKDQKIF